MAVLSNSMFDKGDINLGIEVSDAVFFLIVSAIKLAAFLSGCSLHCVSDAESNTRDTVNLKKSILQFYIIKSTFFIDDYHPPPNALYKLLMEVNFCCRVMDDCNSASNKLVSCISTSR